MRRRLGAPLVLFLALIGAAVALTLTAPSIAPAHPSARVAAGAADQYYVGLLTNVEDNVYVGTQASLNGKYTCQFADGGLCASAGGANTPINFQTELGPYATCADATAAYKAAAMNPHPAFGGTKVYIFGGSYFLDDMGTWCTPGSETTSSVTTTTTTSSETTSGGGEASEAPPLPTRFCSSTASVRAARSAALCAPTKHLSPAEKADARAELRQDLHGVVVLCGTRLAHVHNEQVDQLFEGNFLLAFVLYCPLAIEAMSDTLNQVHDPPAPGYEQVALIVNRPAAPFPAVKCPSSISAAACAAIGSATAPT